MHQMNEVLKHLRTSYFKSFKKDKVIEYKLTKHSAHGAQMSILTESSQNALKSSKFRADYRSDFSFWFGLVLLENLVIKVTASKSSL